jgi:predicted DNA-binding transcriptional regulator AlpA
MEAQMSLALTEDRWWTVEDVARYFQVPPKTVHTWRYTRTGPRGVKIGRHVRFRESEIHRWETEREDAAAS